MNNRRKDIIVGLLFIIVGIILGGNAFGIWDINIFFPGWWTMFLIIPGIVMLFTEGITWGSGIMITVGVILLLGALGIADTHLLWRLFFPIMLIIGGISILRSRKSSVTGSDAKENEGEDKGNYPKYEVYFSNGNYKNTSENLTGIKLESVMGTLNVDLREANIVDGMRLKITSVFSTVKVLLPENVYIEITKSTPLFGNLDNRVKNSAATKKVNLAYETVFGSININ